MNQKLKWLFDSEAFAGDPLADDLGGPAGKTHDWRNYISDELKELWPELNEETRAVAALITESIANSEEWD